MDENTPWTSIDVYYKGFHVKKSLPDNKSALSIKSTIEDLINEGFEPSWNADTSKTHLTPKPASKATTEDQNDFIESLDVPMCGIHKVPMNWREPGISKTTGKAYNGFWACPMKNPDGSFCKYRPE